MTPEELNTLVETVADALHSFPGIDSARVITPADEHGTEPEIGVEVNGESLVLVVTLA